MDASIYITDLQIDAGEKVGRIWLTV